MIDITSEKKKKIDALNKNSIDTLVELAIVPRHLILSNNNVPKWPVTRYRGGSRCSRPFGKNRSIPPSRKGWRPQLSGFFIPRFRKLPIGGQQRSRHAGPIHGGPPSGDPAPFAMGGGFARETANASGRSGDRPLSFAILDGHSACIASPSFHALTHLACVLRLFTKP